MLDRLMPALLLILCLTGIGAIHAQEPEETPVDNPPVQQADQTPVDNPPVQQADQTPADNPPDQQTEQAQEAQGSQGQALQTSPRVMIIPVSDNGKYMVDQVQAEFIIAALEQAEAENYDRVILTIDTFGGIVFSAREITERLLRLKVPSTAYVETKAISAGTFIAWACDEIVMETKTTMGDAQMIMQTAEGIEEAPEKMVTVYRSDWKKSSEAKNRPFAVALGFFEKDVEVLQVGTTQQFSFITREDYNLLAEDQREPIMEIISKKDQLLTLFAEEAHELGLVSLADDWDSWLAGQGISPQQAQEIEMTLNQDILRFLGANSWIYFLLVLVGLNGLYMEIKAPGFGIPGLTALVCFVIVFGSRYFLGTANVLEMVIFVLGLALCLAEIFVLPGFGIAGMSGLSLILGSLVLASMPDFGDILPQHEIQREWMMDLAKITIAGFALSLVTLALIIPTAFQSRMAQKHMLPNELTAEDGYVIDTVSEEGNLIGETGTVNGGLRPTGKVTLDDGRFLDVVSDGPFIDDGQRVQVTATDGNRIIVRAHDMG